MDTVTEPSRQVPVAGRYDVVVAGGGVAGVFAALGAARLGARTALVERFGSVGGNIGPGMIVNGHMISGRAHDRVWYECTVYPRLYGLGKEFIDRYAELGGGSIPPLRPTHYPWDASIASYVAQQMLEESGVALHVSTAVADPIVEGTRVRGLFVEGKSGRRALTAKVVVDATGEADLVRRAGAPVLYPKPEYHEIDGHAPTGMGLFYLVGGIDWDRFDQYVAGVTLTDEEVAWARQHLDEGVAERQPHLVRPLRRAAAQGEGPPRGSVRLGEAEVGISVGSISRLPSPGLGQGRAAPARLGPIDAGDAGHIAALETAQRARIFENVLFYRRWVPGFADACLLCIAPFLGVRGGPCIEGEYTLTMDDCRAGRRFPDVLYLYGEFRALRYTAEQGQPLWVDFPYRAMLPRGLDGLLAVGRSASGIPDTLLRNRMAAKVMGQAGGVAAALAAAADVGPKELDVRQLQASLLDAGFHLGDRHRLKELGLV
ncbi:MAG: FAD-dependent oxidoreductase [Gemmatimonadota bacterium]